MPIIYRSGWISCIRLETSIAYTSCVTDTDISGQWSLLWRVARRCGVRGRELADQIVACHHPTRAFSWQRCWPFRLNCARFLGNRCPRANVVIESTYMHSASCIEIKQVRLKQSACVCTLLHFWRWCRHLKSIVTVCFGLDKKKIRSKHRECTQMMLWPWWQCCYLPTRFLLLFCCCFRRCCCFLFVYFCFATFNIETKKKITPRHRLKQNRRTSS